MSEARKIPVSDRRRQSPVDVASVEEAEFDPARDDGARSPSGEETTGAEPGAVSTEPGAVSTEPGAVAPDYLGDLQRLQAEFENYRKRMMREQSQLAERASLRLIERLLPVLDDLERAVQHGGGGGIDLVMRSFKDVLAAEGVEDIPAEGQPFDPRIHEAFALLEDPSVDEPTCRTVMRTGYRLNDQVIRPAMVSVARPPEGPPEAVAPAAERADGAPEVAPHETSRAAVADGDDAGEESRS